ncbi:MAG: RIP metalloprotease RseP [Candidatus Omnitrophica bacterium]|nr:RIP metalloprotease RseP [Candidatus Omnitrophota bacterium]
MNLLILIAALSVLIIIHELGHFLTARAFGVKVERFSIGFGPVLLKRKAGQTEYAVSLLPLGGYVKMAGEQAGEATGSPEEYGSRPVWQRFAIVGAGPVVNYAAGIFLFTVVFWAGYPVLVPRIGAVMENYPAAEAGLLPGDRIVRINEKPADSWEALTETIRKQTSGAPVRFLVKRDGAERVIEVQPQVREGRSIFGKPARVAMVGMTPSGEVQLVRYGLIEAAVKSVEHAIWLTGMTFQAFWYMATGAMPIKDSLTGPVGIFYLTTSAAALGWRYLLQLFALLSVSLGIFNVLPIPVLDGGHLAFLAVEGLRRKPVSMRIQEKMSQVGMCLLLGMLLMVTYNDLAKIGVFEKITGLFR